MFKHTQTVRLLLPTNCLGVFDHFVGLALKGLQLSAPIYLLILAYSINRSLDENKFSDELKQSEVIPLYKKLDPLKKRTTGP